MTTYISPSLPGMIRNLWKSDPSERSVRTALNLAGDLIQELIDLRDQPSESPGVGNADIGDISAEPSDAEIEAVADVLEGLDGCDFATIARAALLAAREVAGR